MGKPYFKGNREYVIILLPLDSEMRLGECSALLISDIELARREKTSEQRNNESKG